MDMTNFKDGTILDNIIKVNDRMSEQLNLRIDLRKETCMDEENETEKQDAVKALEDKLDQYIIEFVNLNAKNKHVLKEKFDELNRLSDDKIVIFEMRLQQHVEALKANTENEKAIKEQFKKELEIYTQQLHDDFDKIEGNRLSEKQKDITLIQNFRKENADIKVALKQQE
jgi:hypothetical protein